MKKILVATDFTPASANALAYAVKIARPFNAKVLLYHAYVSAVYIPDFVLLPAEGNLQEKFEGLLKEQVNLLPVEDRIYVETKCEPGYPAEAILAAAKQADADLIVAGMKEKGKGVRKLFGSTIFPVYRYSLVPVLVIPENISYKPIKKIALACDYVIKNNHEFLNPLIALTTMLHASLDVISVVKDEHVESNDAAFEINLALSALTPKYHFIEGNDIDGAIAGFVTNNHIDLLAMVAHPHSLLEGLFQKSNIKQLVLAGTVPLFILPDRFDREAAKATGTNTGAVNELAS